ncbi:hypothetical protein Nepgr_029411 [Nepenthes gracilis]|uniref:Cytochrome b5 heme-binding domain-containing protein n=1 Tax=Nepenthes gracilis TaxID=150966 RepID=A0AAD3Y387_NEPGR|nr:hypothetical protein Nepgr_029411 [Nepenthes gracilis]
MPTLTKLFSMQEISQHKAKDDCWLVIDGKVYDVTTYLDEHPGGDDVVLEVTGKDAKEEFEDAGHSKSARELLETFCIGELDPDAPVITKHGISSMQHAHFVYKLKELPLQYWAVPAALVGISVVVGFQFLHKK